MTEKLPEKEKKRRPDPHQEHPLTPRLVTPSVNIRTSSKDKISKIVYANSHACCLMTLWVLCFDFSTSATYNSSVGIVCCTVVSVMQDVSVAMLDIFLSIAISEKRMVY
nr:hypothetical protein BaRGS_013046 [Batillaria attramentaria]